MEEGMTQAADDDDFPFHAFSLDGTVFENKGERYYVWAEKTGVGKQVSNLYIARMASPVKLATMMIPFAVVMIPQYVMFSRMGLTNTLLPLILPGLFGSVSIVFFLRQNLTSIPDSLVEAAKIDGCGYFKMYYSIFLPLMKGALMTQIILWFMGIWNDYLAPTIFIQKEKWFTLQVVIRSFNSFYAVNSDYPLIMAASVLAILPTLLLFFFFQRYIIESIAVSGVKG